MNQGLKMTLIIGGIIIGVSVISWLSWDGEAGYGYGMMGSGMMGGLGTMFLMPVLWLAVIGLIIWAVSAAVNKTGGSESSIGRSGESAQDILKKRYARGEINKQEYEEKKKDLT